MPGTLPIYGKASRLFLSFLVWLGRDYIDCTRTFFALPDLEFDFLALIKRCITLHLNL